MILDSIMRGVYIISFLATGIWALLFNESYGKLIGITMDQPAGRGEISTVGGVYLITSILMAYNWFKKQDSILYKNPAFVMGAIILSRLVSTIKGDFDG